MQKLKDHWILILILCAGAAIRLYGLRDMDYHHDELSALVRTRFHSFFELIVKGVLGDGHPAGTQVFLWIWTALVGYEPWKVKLPFILAGIWAIYLLYAITRHLFGKSSATVAAAMMAVLQYGITYSQWARPYSPGVLFVLGAVYALVRFQRDHSRKWLVLFAGTAMLCGYTHYFGLLQVMLFTITWWVGQPRADRISIAKASGIAAALWLPHLPLTINHLRLGGIGHWLHTPEPDFWLELLAYSFHFSVWLVLLVTAGALFSLLRNFDYQQGWAFRGILLFAVVAPYVISYVYSTQVSALLHNGTMFFAFPFLLMLVASLVQFRRQWTLALFAGLFMTLGLYTLSKKRQHFDLNLRTEYSHPFEWATQYRTGRDLPLLFDLRRDMVRMMAAQQLADTTGLVFFWPLWEQGLLQDYLDTLSADRLMTVITASSEPEYLAAVIDHYPCIEAVTHYQVGSAYLLSRDCDSRYRVTRQQWYVEGSPTYTGIQMHAHNDFSPPIEFAWDRFSDDDTFLLVRAEWTGADTTAASIVAEIKLSDTTAFWHATDLRRFASHGRGINHAYLQFELRDVPHASSRQDRFMTYVWQKGSDTIALRALDVFTYPGNPVKYKLFEQ